MKGWREQRKDVCERLAVSDPITSGPQDFFGCFFCGAEAIVGGAELVHKDDCLWQAAAVLGVRTREALSHFGTGGFLMVMDEQLEEGWPVEDIVRQVNSEIALHQEAIAALKDFIARARTHDL